MIWKTCSVRVASRPATAITSIAVSQPAIQAAALRGEGVAAGMATILAQCVRLGGAADGSDRRKVRAADPTMMGGCASCALREIP